MILLGYVPVFQGSSTEVISKERFLRLVAHQEEQCAFLEKGGIKINEGPEEYGNNHDGTRTFWGKWTPQYIQGKECTKWGRREVRSTKSLQERYHAQHQHLYVVGSRELSDGRIALDVKIKPCCTITQSSPMSSFYVITTPHGIIYKIYPIGRIYELTKVKGAYQAEDVTDTLAWKSKLEMNNHVIEQSNASESTSAWDRALFHDRLIWVKLGFSF